MQQLGKYRIIQEIGSGGMAVVYKGYDTDLKRVVAIKVLPETYARDLQFVQRFQHEAVMAARLHHTNIVTIYDVGQQGNLNYIVMQYLAGASLDQVIAHNGPLPVEAAVAVIGQVAAALEHAHERGIVHRDVKPSNIMVSAEGNVTLMDFGLVRAGESSGITRVGMVVGTPEFMSPEQAQGQPIDLRTDIYSLGIVLYNMLTGKSPFARSTPYSTLLAQVNDPLSFEGLPAPLPAALKRVLQKATAKPPDARYQSARAFVEDLERATGVSADAPAVVALPAATTRPTVVEEAPRVSSLPTQLMADNGKAQAEVPAGPLVSVPGRQETPQMPPSPIITAPARKNSRVLFLIAIPLFLLLVSAAVLLSMNARSQPTPLPSLVPATLAPDSTAQPVVATTVAPVQSPEPGATVPAVPSPTPVVVVEKQTVLATQVVVVTATPATILTSQMITVTATSVPTSTPQSIPVALASTATRQPEQASAPELPTPTLLNPPERATVNGPTTFSWSWNGPPLDNNQGFEVRIWKIGQPDHYGAADPVQTTSATFDPRVAYGPAQGGAGIYYWTVAVVQRQPYRRIGLEAAPRTIVIEFQGGIVPSVSPPTAPPPTAAPPTTPPTAAPPTAPPPTAVPPTAPLPTVTAPPPTAKPPYP